MSRAARAVVGMLLSLGLMGLTCGGSSSSPPPVPPPPQLPPAITPPPRPAPRAVSAEPGSCDGLLDLGGELSITGVRTVGLTYPDAATAEMHLELDLQNTGGARLRSGSVLPDFTGAADLGVQAMPAPLAAEFGLLLPGGSTTTTAPLLLRLPAGNQEALRVRLLSGALPLHAFADEENVLAPGVELNGWTSVEDRMYFLASQPAGGYGFPPNADPGAGPFLPGQEFTVYFLETTLDGASTAFDLFAAGDDFFLEERPGAPNGALTSLPAPYRTVRVVEATRLDAPGDGFTAWSVRLKLPDTESLPQLYTSLSHCSGTKLHVDPPVQASRVSVLDGDPVPGVEVEGRGQPVRFNDYQFSNGIVTLSGQVAGHVLKPSFTLRIRNGRVETTTRLENQLTFTAELRAEREVSRGPESVQLWGLCFPLPAFHIGFIPVESALGISHEVGMSGSVGLGAEIGFEKRFEADLSTSCSGGPGHPTACTFDTTHKATPTPFTPPHFTEATGFNLRVETTLRALLRVGTSECSTGPGFSLDATAYARAEVDPGLSPWWSTHFGLELVGVADLAFLGLDVSRYETPIASWEDGLSNADMFPPSPGAPGSRTSGGDQRWSVALDDIGAPNGVDRTTIAPLPDGSSLVTTTEPVGGRNRLLKLDPRGALLWVKQLGQFERKVSRVRALPDGTAVAVGSPAWLARLDADGNLLWSHDAAIGRASPATARCNLTDVAALERSPGVYDYVAVGEMGTGLVTTVDACALRVNADGTLAWSRIYAGDRGQVFDGVTATRDGQVVAVGYDSWEFGGHRSIPLLVKLDSTTGDVVWAKGMPMTRLGGLSAVVEAADGTLFASGYAIGTILTTGAALVARIGSDGSDARHALFFEDAGWEAAFDAAWTGTGTFTPWVDGPGGDTAYDTFPDLVAVPDGVVAVGSTGLGADRVAWAVKVNGNLGTEWMTGFDGPSLDVFTGVAATADGYLVSGYSASLPEADGGSGESQIWVTKLPVSGRVRFSPDVPVAVRYVSAGVRASSLDLAVNPTGEPAIDRTFSLEDGVPVSGGPNTGVVRDAPAYCARLLTATGQVTTTDSCPD